MLVRDFFKESYWPRVEKNYAKNTVVHYNYTWRKHLMPVWGNYNLEDITPKLLDKWLLDEEITVDIWKQFKAFLRIAYKYGEIDKDPTDRCLNKPIRTKPTPRILSYEEMQVLMDGLIGTPMYTTVCVSCYCGLRREEVCALTWEDFEWNIEDGELSYVNITKGVIYLHRKEIQVKPKTPMSRRRLPLPHDLVRRIYPYREKTGRLLGEYNVAQCADMYKNYTKKHNLPYVPLSNLRTSWATYMTTVGAPITLISRYMGHTNSNTTLTWYAKPGIDELNQLLDIWDRPSMQKYDSPRPDLMRSPEEMDYLPHQKQAYSAYTCSTKPINRYFEPGSIRKKSDLIAQRAPEPEPLEETLFDKVLNILFPNL